MEDKSKNDSKKTWIDVISSFLNPNLGNLLCFVLLISLSFFKGPCYDSDMGFFRSSPFMFAMF